MKLPSCATRVQEPSALRRPAVFSCFRSYDLQHSPVSSLMSFDKKDFSNPSASFFQMKHPRRWMLRVFRPEAEEELIRVLLSRGAVAMRCYETGISDFNSPGITSLSQNGGCPHLQEAMRAREGAWHLPNALAAGAKPARGSEYPECFLQSDYSQSRP
jgi:hypothetical protein